MKDFLDFAVTNARAEFPVILPLRVVCSWCETVLQDGAPNARTSHSICPACHAAHFQEEPPCER